MMRNGQFTKSLAFILAVCGMLSLATAKQLTPKQRSSQILETTGIKGGLVIHLGCSDGRLTAALRANDSYLVHGLDTDVANVARARDCLLYTSPSPRDRTRSRMPSSA